MKTPTTAPDPAAVLGAAMSLYGLNSREDCETSDAFEGHDEFMRLCMRIATEFETWSCANVDFNALGDVWPYLLHDHFLWAVEECFGRLTGDSLHTLAVLNSAYFPAIAGKLIQRSHHD